MNHILAIWWCILMQDIVSSFGTFSILANLNNFYSGLYIQLSIMSYNYLSTRGALYRPLNLSTRFSNSIIVSFSNVLCDWAHLLFKLFLINNPCLYLMQTGSSSIFVCFDSDSNKLIKILQPSILWCIAFTNRVDWIITLTRPYKFNFKVNTLIISFS